MSVVITRDDLKAYTEVDYIINHMNIKYKEKVPEKMLTFFGALKDPEYEVKINPYVPLQNQGLQRYALEIIALLHLKYWCEDEERKKELYDIMLSNQEKLEAQMRERYNVENLFSNDDKKDDQQIETEDFSKPRVVQRYSQYEETNDIQDYTDHVEETNPSQDVGSQLPTQSKDDSSKGFFSMLITKITSFFKKG